MEQIKKLKQGEKIVCVKRWKEREKRRIDVRKPQKSIRHRKTFRSHELIACQKASLPCSVCVTVKTVLFNSVWKKEIWSAFPRVVKLLFPCLTAEIIIVLQTHSHRTDWWSRSPSCQNMTWIYCGKCTGGSFCVAFVGLKCSFLNFGMLLKWNRGKSWEIISENPPEKMKQQERYH